MSMNNSIVKSYRRQQCYSMFLNMAEALIKHYDLVASSNNDGSAYLIPKGSNEHLSYYEKPVNSFRISDHWNWYSNIKKCDDPKLIQCYSADMPYPRKREQEGKATSPRFGMQIAFYGPDKKYHHVFGEKFDQATGSWAWEEPSADDILWHSLGFVR